MGYLIFFDLLVCFGTTKEVGLYFHIYPKATEFSRLKSSIVLIFQALRLPF